jgi:hypothetical protein
MGIAYGAGRRPDSGLVLHLDAGNAKSYPGTGNTWFDISGSNNHFTINTTAFNSAGKYMDFNGSYGCAKKTNSDVMVKGNATAIVWTRILNSASQWRTLFRGLSSGNDHQVIIESGGWNIGMYDGTNGTGANYTGYSQQSLPGYGTSSWNMLVWRWNDTFSPYYSLSYNDSPETIRGSITSPNARFKTGICSIGAYNNGAQANPSDASQYWGDIASVALYNRVLTDEEINLAFDAGRGRYGL